MSQSLHPAAIGGGRPHSPHPKSPPSTAEAPVLEALPTTPCTWSHHGKTQCQKTLLSPDRNKGNTWPQGRSLFFCLFVCFWFFGCFFQFCVHSVQWTIIGNGRSRPHLGSGDPQMVQGACSPVEPRSWFTSAPAHLQQGCLSSRGHSPCSGITRLNGLLRQDINGL